MKKNIYIVLACLLASGITPLSLAMSRIEVQKQAGVLDKKATEQAINDVKQTVNEINKVVSDAKSATSPEQKRSLLARAGSMLYSIAASPYYGANYIFEKVWGSKQKATVELTNLENSISTEMSKLDMEKAALFVNQLSLLQKDFEKTNLDIQKQIIDPLKSKNPSFNSAILATFKDQLNKERTRLDTLLASFPLITNTNMSAEQQKSVSASLSDIADKAITTLSNLNTALKANVGTTTTTAQIKSLVGVLLSDKGLVKELVELLETLGQLAEKEESVRIKDAKVPLIFSSFDKKMRDKTVNIIKELGVTKIIKSPGYSKLTKGIVFTVGACLVGAAAHEVCKRWWPEKVAQLDNVAIAQYENIRSYMPSFNWFKASTNTDTPIDPNAPATQAASGWFASISNKLPSISLPSRPTWLGGSGNNSLPSVVTNTNTGEAPSVETDPNTVEVPSVREVLQD